MKYVYMSHQHMPNHAKSNTCTLQRDMESLGFDNCYMALTTDFIEMIWHYHTMSYLH